MARTVEEWIGKTDDAKIPKSVRARIFLREDGICHIARRKIRPGEPYDFDHVVPLSMGGEHRESNLKPALRDKHREKTAAEAKPRSKTDRQRAYHLGLKPKPQGNNRLRSRGFEKRWQG